MLFIIVIMFFSIIFAEKFNVMEVIAENSQVRSTLHGIFTPFRDGIIFTFRVVFYGGSRSQGNLTFSDISDLTDYLLDDCGYDSITFKKL